MKEVDERARQGFKSPLVHHKEISESKDSTHILYNFNLTYSSLVVWRSLSTKRQNRLV